MSSLRTLLTALILGLILAAPAAAEVLRVEVVSRETVLGGQRFGDYGPYEVIRGRIVFGFDPANPMNDRIVDLGLAPRNAAGLVEAVANFVVLKPVDPARGSGTALVEVSNRGGKFSPRYYSRATTASLDPDDPAAFGDALLMRMGLTVIWVGWQFDVPERPGALRLEVPRARGPGGEPITGLVRSDWVVDEPAAELAVSHRGHIPYPVIDPDDPANALTVRDGRDAQRRTVPRSAWRFARERDGRVVPSRAHIRLEGGFEAGKIYELVYRAQDPAVVGLGLAVIRDVIAYAKHDPESAFPVERGIAAGVSQTGRFLRHFLYQGFNTDEAGRQAYDGLMVITAGAGRGSFNHRFAQPSRDAHRYSAFFYPTDIFPFTSRAQFDPEQWRTDGLLSHLHDPAHAPKTFYINTGYEYWGRAASLIHTSVFGRKDVEPLPTERIYHLASGQHFVNPFPDADAEPVHGGIGYRGNPLDFSVNYRALLVRLVEWVDDDVPPPASAYPRRDRGTLVPLDEIDFPRIPGIRIPDRAHVAYRADYGPRWPRAVDIQPPRLGLPFPPQMSRTDRFGNEVAGVRNVEIRVPLATYTPWNLRTGAPGAESELTDFRGTFIPLPRTEAERERTGDPRPSIESLYTGRGAYLDRVRVEARALVDAGFLLPDDVDHVLRNAERSWDWIHR